jgi:osmotically-inducible protein OsmY
MSERALRWTTFAAGLSAGVIAMFLLDPRGGRRRRHLLLDKSGREVRDSRRVVTAKAFDLAHRSYGTLARLRSLLRPAPRTDELIVERVRARIGHRVRHAHSVQIRSRAGIVELTGKILPRDADRLIRTVKMIKGVKEIVNHLQIIEPAIA